MTKSNYEIYTCWNVQNIFRIDEWAISFISYESLDFKLTISLTTCQFRLVWLNNKNKSLCLKLT